MRQLLFLGILVALLGACNDKNAKEETCDPADNPGCTQGECIAGSACYDGVFECQDGVWVEAGHCDPAPPDAGPDAGPDAAADAGPDAEIDGSVPDAGPGSVPDAGGGTDATVL